MVLQAAPSLCGILVYKNVTSRVTNRVSDGKLSIVSNFNKKFVVSLTYDGIVLTSGLDGSM